MTREPDTLVIVATYNEIENLPTLVESIFEALPDSHLLVIDDNSPDGTGDWCDQQAQEDSRLRCLHRAGKLGLGSATIDGLRQGLAGGYGRLITMDADFSHDPRHLPALVDKSKDAEVVIGSRYCPGGGVENWPWHRRLISRVLNATARTLLGLPVRDCSGAFRCYRSQALQRFDLATVQAQGYAYLEEILWRFHTSGATFAETPITFVERRAGQSKINWREGLGAVRVLMRLFWERLRGKKNEQPH